MFWGGLEGSCMDHGGSWGILGASWGILEGFWRVFEESCMDLGGDFGGIVRILGGFWGGPGGPRKS